VGYGETAMAHIKLTLVNIDGCHIDTDKGEMTIRNLKFSFDSSGTEIEIDFLEAIKIALKAIESGEIKVGFIN
jgi:hypothetical protein